MNIKNLLLGLIVLLTGCCVSPTIGNIDDLKNENHPRVLYWFWTPATVANEHYLADIDRIVDSKAFDLVFMTARDGADFYDYDVMYPAFEKAVSYAHSKGLKLGLQLFDGDYAGPEEQSTRFISEKCMLLDHAGKASCEVEVKHFRTMQNILQTGVMKAWAFRKDKGNLYEESSLKVVTDQVHFKPDHASAGKLTVDCGKELAGYHVYVLLQSKCNFHDLFVSRSARLFEALQKYATIPFDGTALDEYGYIRVSPPWHMKKDYLDERYYSLGMDSVFHATYHENLVDNMLHMRYAPKGQPILQAVSINRYMDVMRGGPMRVQKDFYTMSKELYGKDTFIGVHSTYHNNQLVGDELWTTGAQWWTLPREYGHTDEGTILPVTMGVGQCAPMNVMYNMFYKKDAEDIYRKATGDLAYGIRTHYHAYNDHHGWGVSLDSIEVLKNICHIEHAACLLNKFNPKFPKMDVLLVMGMEAQQNWYPDEKAQSHYRVNDRVRPLKVAKKLWQQGYRVTLVSSDVIDAGKLKVNRNGTVSLNGHQYRNMVYLYPQFIKQSTLNMLKEMKDHRGRLMLYGDEARWNFDGKEITEELKELGEMSHTVGELVAQFKEMCIIPKRETGFCSVNEDGSVVKTFYPSLHENSTNLFNLIIDGYEFTGECTGLIAIQTNGKGGITKMTGTGVKTIRRDGVIIFELSAPSDIYVQQDKQTNILLKDENVKVVYNQLR